MRKVSKGVVGRIRRAVGLGREVLPSGYVAERRRATLAQIRRLTLMALAPTATGLALSVLAFSDHLLERLASPITGGLACLGTHCLARLELGRRGAIPLAMTFVAVTLGTGLWWVSFLPSGLDVLVGAAMAVAAMMMAALVLPWGPAPQLVVSLVAALGFFCLLSWSPFDVSRSINMLIALGLGVLPSTVSAHLLDRRRAAIFAERRRAEVRSFQQSVLAQLGQKALGPAADVAALMSDAVVLAAEALRVDCVALLELLPDNRGLRLRAGLGWSQGLVGAARVSADSGSLAGHVLGSGDPVLVEDLQKETRFGPPPLLTDHGVVSGISVVIPNPDRPFGVLGAYTTTPRSFFDDDVGFLRSVALVMGGAVERSRAKQALSEAGQRQARLLAASPAILYITEASGQFRLTFVSENTTSTLGYTPRELLEASSPVDLVPAEDRPFLIGAGRRLAKEGSTTVECRLRYKDGTYRSTQHKLRLLRDQQGRPLEVVGSCTDLAEREEIEKKLREARDTAEAAGRAKREFLDNISHEIRTPMNAIFGMTDILLDSPLSSEQRDHAETVRRSAQSLLSIIEDILDFSKIEAGRLELQPRSFHLREHFDDTLRLVIPAASRKGIGLVVDVLPEVPDLLLGDPQRLRQLLVNLIGNAIKFTQHGRIVVSVSVEARAEDGVVLQFSVADTGIGIREEKRREIFEAFVQADGSMTREYGGTGLGLAISAQLVGMMGGRIWFESEVGQGTTFVFTARFGLQQETYVGVDRPWSGIGVARSPLRILVAEDDAVNRTVVVRLLEKRGHAVVTAEDGEQALVALGAQPFDVVVMDVQMPKKSGLETTEAIRTREQTTGGHIPIVALTAHAMRRDRDRCLQAGMDAYVTKPIQAVDLFTAIEGAGDQPGGEDTALAAELAGPTEPVEAPDLEEEEAATSGVLHREELRGRVGGDPALLLDLVKVFQEDSRRLLEELRNGLSHHDSRVVENAAHRLKSSLDTMAAMSAHDAAQRLETLGREGDLEPAEHALSVLECELDRLRPELDALAKVVVGSAGSRSADGDS